MSLRGFHIFFVIMVTLLSFGTAAAAFAMGFDPRFWGSVAGFGLLIAIYGIWFVRKSRKLII